MSVRWAQPADLQAIRAVAEASWQSDYPFITRERLQQGVNRWYTPSNLERAISNPSTRLLVAESGGSVVGFAHAWLDHERGEGDILRIYVHPGYRSHGIGTTLFSRTADALFAEGIDRIRAMVLDGNRVGNQFYQQLGLQKADQSRTMIGGEWHQENAYLLERRPTTVQREPVEQPVVR